MNDQEKANAIKKFFGGYVSVHTGDVVAWQGHITLDGDLTIEQLERIVAILKDQPIV